MSTSKGFLFELERETAGTRRILEGLKDEHLSWKPHPKSKSVGELANHIVELHNWVSGALQQDDFDFHQDYLPLQKTSIAEIRTALEEGYQQNIAAISAFSEEDWSKKWTMRAGEAIVAQMPKIGTLRFVINNHLIHHRGQMSVYLRLLDIRVPGIYGPSADELAFS